MCGGEDSVDATRGRSSEAEHQLPKLRTRVRFPSPALSKHRRSNPVSGVTSHRVLTPQTPVVPQRAIERCALSATWAEDGDSSKLRLAGA
jgi:hypothetical protein